MEGLVQADKYEGVTFQDPVTVANEIAAKLKEVEGCDAVVCLSHMGIKEDEMLVHQTRILMWYWVGTHILSCRNRLFL